MSVSFTGIGGYKEALPNGAVLQTAVATNNTPASKVFSSRSVYEEVPGTLRVSITPRSKYSVFVARAHIYWGGWNGSTDVSPLFRIYWGSSLGSYTKPLGPFWGGGAVSGNANYPHGVNTGTYHYGFGDNNHSAQSDQILTVGTANDGTSNTKYFALMWACGYEANTRTIYWNRSINTSNAYNPYHNCTLAISEILVKDKV